MLANTPTAVADTAHHPAKIESASAVLVLGMHRGGTSAVAGLLRLLGFDLGASLMPAAEGVNNKGFWEHVEAFKIHERLLAALGRSRFDPRAMPAGWLEHPAFRSAVDEVRALIERDFRNVKRWAIKDPRMCRLAPIWIEALAAAGVQARVIIVARHPLEIARSLQAQGWISSSARSHLCWLQHTLEAERATRGLPRALLQYDALLADWRGEVARLGAELALDFDQARSGIDAEIDAFVDASERHYVESQAVSTQTELPVLVADVFEACVERDWLRLAALGETHERSTAAWGPCLDEAIVEATLTRLEIGQGRIEGSPQAPIDVISLRGRAEDRAYATQAAVVQRHDTRAGAAQLRFDLPAREPIDFLHVYFGDSPGVFRLAQMSVDDTPVSGLAARAHGPDDAAIRWMASGADAIQVVGARGGAWIEIDLRGLPLTRTATRRLRVGMQIEREIGTAELVAIVATLARHDREEVTREAARHTGPHFEALRSAVAALGESDRSTAAHVLGQGELLATTQRDLAAVAEALDHLRARAAAADSARIEVAGKLDALIAAAQRPFWRRLLR